MSRVLICAILALAFLNITSGQTSFAQYRQIGTPTCSVYQLNCLAELDSDDPIGFRRPLILIHGWNPNSLSAPADVSDMLPFLTFYESDDLLRARYKVYVFSYVSNQVNVEDLGNRLADDVLAKDRIDSIFGRRQIVVLGHSMGGLIARVFSKIEGARIARVITLGTPHHGTPMANARARDAKISFGLLPYLQLFDDGFYGLVGPTAFWPNRSDMRWDNYDGRLNYVQFSDERNTWLENLNADRSLDSKIIAYYGNYAPGQECGFFSSLIKAYCNGSAVLGSAFGMLNDGIVPIASASFQDANGNPRVTTRSFDGYNHSEIATGRADGLLFKTLKADLLASTLPLLSNPPFGTIDTPGNNDIKVGEVAVTGWALDDAGIASVDIYANSVYIGSASFIKGARPDVSGAYANYPNHERAGWGYMLMSNFLPNQGNGTFTFTAVARDENGNKTTLGTKTAIFRNATSIKPFGTIDTPAQGETISGVYTNFGWALAPWPNSIPADGSTIEVYVDGRYIGHPVYNNYRADIAGAFPGLKNSNGAVGYVQIDTRTLTNGLHVLGWLVRDSVGNAEGIGSRYITIRN